MPQQIPRQMAILVGLLEPKFGGDVSTFLDKYLNWERRIEELSANSGITLPEQVRCAIIMTKSPKPIRRYLENQAMQVQTSYPAMRQALQLYLYRLRSFNSEGVSSAMEVDELHLPEDFEEEEEVGVPSMYMYQLETDAEPFACSCVTAKSGTCEVFCFLT